MAAPLTETGMKKIVGLRKGFLTALGRTPRFHRLRPTTGFEPATQYHVQKFNQPEKITFRSRRSRGTLQTEDENGRVLRWQVVGEIRVWLCRAHSHNWPRECKIRRRIFARVESHQSFRSVSDFALAATKDRLDDHGGILSPASARFSSAHN